MAFSHTPLGVCVFLLKKGGESVKVNGKTVAYQDGMTIEKLIKTLNLDPETIVVEVNQDIVSKESFGSWCLKKEDQVEIVAFVGGG